MHADSPPPRVAVIIEVGRRERPADQPVTIVAVNEQDKDREAEVSLVVVEVRMAELQITEPVAVPRPTVAAEVMVVAIGIIEDVATTIATIPKRHAAPSRSNARSQKTQSPRRCSKAKNHCDRSVISCSS